MTAETTLAQLADKAAITEQIYRYCRGLDRLDEATLRAVYHPDALEERGEDVYVGNAHDMAPIALAALNKGYTASQHFIGNVMIELEGDVAFAESYFRAYHRYRDRPGKPSMEMIMGGRYLDRFERRGGEWKIAHRKMMMDWERTQPVSEGWLVKHPSALRSRRDISDTRVDRQGAADGA